MPQEPKPRITGVVHLADLRDANCFLPVDIPENPQAPEAQDPCWQLIADARAAEFTTELALVGGEPTEVLVHVSTDKPAGPTDRPVLRLVLGAKGGTEVRRDPGEDLRTPLPMRRTAPRSLRGSEIALAPISAGQLRMARAHLPQELSDQLHHQLSSDRRILADEHGQNLFWSTCRPPTVPGYEKYQTTAYEEVVRSLRRLTRRIVPAPALGTLSQRHSNYVLWHRIKLERDRAVREEQSSCSNPVLGLPGLLTGAVTAIVDSPAWSRSEVELTPIDALGEEHRILVQAEQLQQAAIDLSRIAPGIAEGSLGAQMLEQDRAMLAHRAAMLLERTLSLIEYALALKAVEAELSRLDKMSEQVRQAMADMAAHEEAMAALHAWRERHGHLVVEAEHDRLAADDNRRAAGELQELRAGLASRVQYLQELVASRSLPVIGSPDQ